MGSCPPPAPVPLAREAHLAKQVFTDTFFFFSSSGSLPAIFELLSAERSEASPPPAPCWEQAAGSALSWPPRLSAKQAECGSHALTRARGVPMQRGGSCLSSRLRPGLQSKSGAVLDVPAWDGHCSGVKEEGAGSGAESWLQVTSRDPLLQAQSPGSAQGVAP